MHNFIYSTIQLLMNGTNKVNRTAKGYSGTRRKTKGNEETVSTSSIARVSTADTKRIRIGLRKRKVCILQSERSEKDSKESIIARIFFFFTYHPHILFTLMYIDSMFLDEVLTMDIQMFINRGMV